MSVGIISGNLYSNTLNSRFFSINAWNLKIGFAFVPVFAAAYLYGPLVAGLVGALGIMALFAALILRGYWIALRASDRFSTVLAAGLTTLIAVQTILNLFVVTNLLPSTGIALPFFSYGGTALAVNLGEMGIVLRISRQRDRRNIQEA